VATDRARPSADRLGHLVTTLITSGQTYQPAGSAPRRRIAPSEPAINTPSGPKVSPGTQPAPAHLIAARATVTRNPNPPPRTLGPVLPITPCHCPAAIPSLPRSRIPLGNFPRTRLTKQPMTLILIASELLLLRPTFPALQHRWPSSRCILHSAHRIGSVFRASDSLTLMRSEARDTGNLPFSSFSTNAFPLSGGRQHDEG